MWEDGIPGNVTSFLPQTSFWPEEGNDDSLQVMMMIRRRMRRRRGRKAMIVASRYLVTQPHYQPENGEI